MNDAFGSPRGILSRVLSLLGAALICGSSVAQYLRSELAVWLMITTFVACAGWLALIVFRVRGPHISLVLLAVMVGAGGIAASATGGASLVVAAIAVLWLTRDLRRPVWWGATLGVFAVVVVVAGGLIVQIAPLGMLSMQAGLVVAFLAGESRRQALLADVRSRELIEEQARTDVLASRQQLAHDIHDVLAHSLGGLVIQLDAVDALLDSGDTAAAASKVRDARALAKDGLVEARRAVAALSIGDVGESDADQRASGDAVRAEVEALVAAHRSLGGAARLVETGRRRQVSAAVSTALRRAVQEALTNARKHASGEPVTVTLLWATDGVSVEIANPLGASAGVGGGGHGLVGMRDRFTALPGGTVTSGVERGRFVVTARAATA